MPPGSAKSTYASVVFPAWYLGRHPQGWVIAASHTEELADRFGRRVRNLVASEAHRNVFDGIGVAADRQAAGQWETERGGEYYAAGVGGSITGRRADLGIIDDPVRGRELLGRPVEPELRVQLRLWAAELDDMADAVERGAEASARKEFARPF